MKKRKTAQHSISYELKEDIDDMLHLIAGGKMADYDLSYKETMEEIKNSLSENQYLALTLKLEGYSNPEIAKKMGKTAKAIGLLVVRAKKIIMIRFPELINILKKNHDK